MSKGKAFYFRCKIGPALTEQQFRNMVENCLRLECQGIMCDLFSDWDKEKDGLFWDTTSWTLGGWISPAPNSVKESLQYYARRSLREQGIDMVGRNLDEFVTFKLVVVDLDAETATKS